MRKKLTQQDNCYTPKRIVDFFGTFDYDPCTTKDQSLYLNIPNYDTIDSDGLTTNWGVIPKYGLIHLLVGSLNF